MTDKNQNITFIGLGIMGSRMAKNLLKQGTHITVYNRSGEPVKELEKLGAKAAASLKEAVFEADIVFTMLTTPAVVGDVVLAKGGMLDYMKTGALWIDCTTVNPSFSVQCAKAAADKTIRFIDAPVAGSKPQADAAELIFFTGGSKKDLDEAAPYMEKMGKKILHVGETGKGSSFKMIVNAMLGQAMLVYSESVILGRKMGLPEELLLDLLPELVVTPPFIKGKTGMIRSGQYETQFPLELMQKDLQLAAQTAYELNQPLYMANIAKEVFMEAKKNGLGREDFSAIFKFLAKGE